MTLCSYTAKLHLTEYNPPIANTICTVGMSKQASPKVTLLYNVHIIDYDVIPKN